MTGDDDRPVLLFGTEHADILDVDEWQAAADWFADCRAAGDVFPQTLRVRIFAHSVLPPGDYGGERLPDGETLASRVVDDLDCLLFDELADQLEQAAKLPEVAAAFQAAIDLLASRVPFCVADDVVSSREWQATIAEPGYNWSNPVPVDDDAASDQLRCAWYHHTLETCPAVVSQPGGLCDEHDTELRSVVSDWPAL